MATDAPPAAPRLPEALEAAPPGPLRDEAVLSGCVLEGAFAGQSVGALEIQRSRIVRSTFTAAKLPALCLRDVTLEHCDLSGAVLELSTLDRVRFEDCRMSALDLSRASLRDVVISGCRFDAANLKMSELRRVLCQDVDLRGADLGGATLVGCRLFDCDLRGADFSRVRAGGTRLHGSRLEEVRGAGSLRGVVVDSAQAVTLGLRVLETMEVALDDERDRRADAAAGKRSKLRAPSSGAGG